MEAERDRIVSAADLLAFGKWLFDRESPDLLLGPDAPSLVKSMNTDEIGERREQSRQYEYSDETGTAHELFERLLLPIANETDAEATCAAVRPYIDPLDSHLTVVHVVEKTPDYPDKLPLDAAREHADAIFSVVRNRFADSDYRVSTEVRYGPNIVEETFAAAEDVDATAIGFTPRPGRRWTRILAGDVGYRLVTTSPRPIVVFPHSNAVQK